MPQMAWGAREPLQLFVWLNPALAAMLAMVSVAFPVLVRVTAWAALVVPTAWLGNVKLAGERAAPAPVPAPARAIV